MSLLKVHLHTKYPRSTSMLEILYPGRRAAHKNSSVPRRDSLLENNDMREGSHQPYLASNHFAASIFNHVLLVQHRVHKYARCNGMARVCDSSPWSSNSKLSPCGKTDSELFLATADQVWRSTYHLFDCVLLVAFVEHRSC